MICLLTAVGLTPGGSSTVHIYTQTIQRTTQLSTRNNTINNRTTQLPTRNTRLTIINNNNNNNNNKDTVKWLVTSTVSTRRKHKGLQVTHKFCKHTGSPGVHRTTESPTNQHCTHFICKVLG